MGREEVESPKPKRGVYSALISPVIVPTHVGGTWRTPDLFSDAYTPRVCSGSATIACDRPSLDTDIRGTPAITQGYRDSNPSGTVLETVRHIQRLPL